MPPKKSTNKYVGKPFISRIMHELYEVEQILGKALGYPEVNGEVDTGDITAATLAMLAADKLRKQNGNN